MLTYPLYDENADDFDRDFPEFLDSVLLIVEPHETRVSPQDEQRRAFYLLLYWKNVISSQLQALILKTMMNGAAKHIKQGWPMQKR